MKRNYLRITDLGVAAALKVAGMDLIQIDPAQNQRAVFLFPESREIESLVNDYWSGKLLVSALRFQQEMRLLKSRAISATS